MKNFIFLLSILLSFSIFSQKETASLDKLMDTWHLAATNADFKAYFAPTTTDFIFLGTAPNERWTKKDFQVFSKPYFDKGKAWDFKASNRKWNFSKDGKTAWLDEDLKTWMEDCRGSASALKKKGSGSLLITISPF